MRNKITNEQFDSYKFDIDNSYCDANDVNISFNIDKDDDRWIDSCDENIVPLHKLITSVSIIHA